MMKMDFICKIEGCNIDCKDELNLHTHMLFAHNKYMQPCSTSVAIEQNNRAVDIRHRITKLREKIRSQLYHINTYARTYCTNENYVANLMASAKGVIRNEYSWVLDYYGFTDPFMFQVKIVTHYGEKFKIIQRQFKALLSTVHELHHFEMLAKSEGILIDV